MSYYENLPNDLTAHDLMCLSDYALRIVKNVTDVQDMLLVKNVSDTFSSIIVSAFECVPNEEGFNVVHVDFSVKRKIREAVSETHSLIEKMHKLYSATDSLLKLAMLNKESIFFEKSPFMAKYISECFDELYEPSLQFVDVFLPRVTK